MERIIVHRDGVDIGTVTGYGDTWHAMSATAGMLPGYFLTVEDATRAIHAAYCERCTHRATAYGLGPCDAHNGDAWPTRKDN